MHMLRLTIISSIIIVACSYSKESTMYRYTPLSGKEKALFKKTYSDLKKAYESGAYATFSKFAPSMIIEYENIHLDPACKKLRPMYNEIDSLYNAREALVKIENELEQLDLEHKGSALEFYDEYVSIYKKIEDRDSIYKYQRLLYLTADSVISEDPSIANFALVNSLLNMSTEYKGTLKERVEDLFQEKFLQLSSEMNFKDIQEFQKNYPDMFSNEIAQLNEKCRQKEKLSLLRKPSFFGLDDFTSKYGIDKKVEENVRLHYRRQLMRKVDVELFADYYKRFPEDDFQLFSLIEGQLFNRFIEKKTVENADLYLKFFPKGRYANIVMEQLAITEGLAQSQIQ